TYSSRFGDVINNCKTSIAITGLRLTKFGTFKDSMVLWLSGKITKNRQQY
ncbi:unnamed protein product, partial [Schistosoma curassoni]|uniref:Transposase n=1 Tax=Schistosoma curassoni TaxID=6186 RepID=A0A183JJ98_9TREM